MSEELNEGDEVWVRGRFVGTSKSGWATVDVYRGGLTPTACELAIGHVRKSLPDTNEHSETAELERKVVEAAREWGRRASRDNITAYPIEVQNLAAAIDALEKALAPLLEEQIRAELETLVKSARDTEIEKSHYDVSLKHILALVKAHES